MSYKYDRTEGWDYASDDSYLTDGLTAGEKRWLAGEGTNDGDSSYYRAVEPFMLSEGIRTPEHVANYLEDLESFLKASGTEVPQVPKGREYLEDTYLTTEQTARFLELYGAESFDRWGVWQFGVCPDTGRLIVLR
jgi:hypothetical protein